MTTSSSSSATRQWVSARARGATPTSTPSGSSRTRPANRSRPSAPRPSGRRWCPRSSPTSPAASFEPVRHTAMHHRHVELGARMMVAGLWLRPAYYGPKETSATAIEAEVRAVREGVGMIDVSTLGGLDMRGPDAAELDRPHVHLGLCQAAGRPRPLCPDDRPDRRRHRRRRRLPLPRAPFLRHRDHRRRRPGLSPDDAGGTAQWRLDVDVANVTAAYAGVNIAGPKAREVVQRSLESDIDLSADAFPYMACASAGSAAFRCGCCASASSASSATRSTARPRWARRSGTCSAQAGRPFGLKPFGVEAQRVLRLEKGHIIVGQDTDGLTNPAEAGMEWALARKKPFYVGKRAVDIQIAKGVTRRLVGFASPMPTRPAPRSATSSSAAARSPAASPPPCARLRWARSSASPMSPLTRRPAGSRFEIRIEGRRGWSRPKSCRRPSTIRRTSGRSCDDRPPQDFHRRTPLYRALDAEGARLGRFA